MFSRFLGSEGGKKTFSTSVENRAKKGCKHPEAQELINPAASMVDTIIRVVAVSVVIHFIIHQQYFIVNGNVPT